MQVVHEIPLEKPSKPAGNWSKIQQGVGICNTFKKLYDERLFVRLGDAFVMLGLEHYLPIYERLG